MTAYDPQARLDAWLADGWQNDNDNNECVVAGCFVKPAEPGKGWGCSFGTWQQSHPQLHGFATAWEAWAFVFAATGIDAHTGLPTTVRRYESRPQPDSEEIPEPAPEPVQWAMFNV